VTRALCARVIFITLLEWNTAIYGHAQALAIVGLVIQARIASYARLRGCNLMANYLTLDLHLTNNGVELFTHWIELVIPARTILIILAIWLGRKAYKIRQNRGK